MKPDYWDAATAELARRDPVMRKLIAAFPGIHLSRRADAFTTLAHSIVSQQISVKAADAIWRRFVAAVGVANAPPTTPTLLSPAAVGATHVATLRQCGLSQSKAIYLTDLANHFVSGRLDPKTWSALDDEALIAALSDVKGIGRWTAEMFLMFHEGRADVWPIDDIGVQRAVFQQFNGGEWWPREALIAIAELWRPWRSVATWYLWRSIEPNPVEY